LKATRTLATSSVPDTAATATILERGGGGVLSQCALALLRLFGWRVMLARPMPAKSVVVFYPHTSNWDFVVGLLAKWAMGVEFHWLGKHTLFATPLGPLFRHWGGMPVDRGDPGGFLDKLRAAYAASPTFHVVIAPEGTRRRTAHWKSGFHRLATALDVPVGTAFIDRARKAIGVGAWMTLTGDADADLAMLRSFYADKAAWRPDNAGPIRFRDPTPPRER
jgi:1-acyl-sn-glycerol-3-phosphate acyltransferase